MKRYSRQREIILKVLKSRRDHPTANMLYEDVKKELPQIGIATVYRNIADLTEEGIITKIKTKNDGPDRYDANIKPHYHFECLKCNDICDIYPNNNMYNDLSDNIKNMIGKMGAEIIETDIMIRGVCKKCAQNKEGGIIL